jgi:Rad52/22 family double-strand break repair protein
MTDEELVALTEALAAPFAEVELKYKPEVVKGNSCLVITYVDARVIQDRLDEVLGTAGWQDDYDFLPGGSVLCRLRIRLGGEWLTKVDVGSPSEQSDAGDRVKAAVSDALKRAAVKFGIGRYLYRLPQAWCDYDPIKKKIAKLPRLPDWARPKVKPKAPGPPAGAATIAGLHDALVSRDKSWGAALGYYGVDLPADFAEPDSPEEAALLLKGLVPADVAKKLAAALDGRAGKTPSPTA